MKYTCSMKTVQQNGRFTLFSSKFPSNIYSILYGNTPPTLSNQLIFLVFSLTNKLQETLYFQKTIIVIIESYNVFKQIVLYRWINILLKILERYNLNLNRLSWNLFIEMEKTATSYFPPSCFILVLLKKWLILNCELVTDHSNIRSFLFIKLYRNPIIVYWNFTNYFNSYWELNLKCTSKKNKCKSKHWLALYVM